MIFPAEPPDLYRRNVGIMLLNAQGLVWVGRRSDTPDAWQMPQGGVDDGEDLEAAALRELEEETGTAAATVLLQSAVWLTYDLPPSLAGTLWRGRWKGQAQRWFAMRFTGNDGDFRIDGKHGEFDAWRWVARCDLPALIVPFKRQVYEAVLAELEPRLQAAGFLP